MILLVDDNKTLTDKIERLLLSNNYFVESANSFEEGLVKAQNNNQIELAIIDYVLKPGYGTDLIMKLRSLNIPCPCCLISDFPQEAAEAVLKEIEKKHIDYFIPKVTDNYQQTAQLVLDYVKKKLKPRPQIPPEHQPILQFDINDNGFISESILMNDLRLLVNNVITNNYSLLISGDEGSGKSFLAKTICEMQKRKYEILYYNSSEEIIKSNIESNDNSILVFEEITDFTERAQKLITICLENKPKDRLIICTINNQPKTKHENNSIIMKLFNSFDTLVVLPPLIDRRDDLIIITKKIINDICLTLKIDKSIELDNEEKIVIAQYILSNGSLKDLKRILKRVLILTRYISKEAIINEINKEKSIFIGYHNSTLKQFIKEFAYKIVTMPRYGKFNYFHTKLPDIKDMVVIEILKQVLIETNNIHQRCGDIVGYSGAQVGNLVDGK